MIQNDESSLNVPKNTKPDANLSLTKVSSLHCFPSRFKYQYEFLVCLSVDYKSTYLIVYHK